MKTQNNESIVRISQSNNMRKKPMISYNSRSKLINSKNFKHSSHKQQQSSNLQVQVKQLPQIQKYDTNKLFQEFKRSLLKQNKKQNNNKNTLNYQYKMLYDQLKKNNQIKKGKLARKTDILTQKEKNKSFFGGKNKSNLFNSNLNNNSNTGNNCNVNFNGHNNYMSSSIVVNVFNTSNQSHNHGIKQNHDHNKDSLTPNPLNKSNLCSQTQFLQKINNNKKQQTNCKFKHIRNHSNNQDKQFNNSTNNYHNNSKLFTSTSKQPQKLQKRALTASKARPPLLQQKKDIFLSSHHIEILQKIQEQTLLIQSQDCQLKQEIFSLKKSLNKIKKELDQVNRELQIESRNEEKYKHILYLATSIQNQTDYIKLQNLKGFYSMSNRQDDTLTQMKKFKINLKKQKDDMQTQYIQQINNWVSNQQKNNLNKKRQFLFATTHNVGGSHHHNMNNHNRSQIIKEKEFKLDKKLINVLDKILELLKQKQQNFQLIKQQQCTKLRLTKIRKQLLTPSHIQIIQKIQQFESKYDLKISSIQTLIIKIYQKLFTQNQYYQDQCMKINKIKENIQNDLFEINKKHFDNQNTLSNHNTEVNGDVLALIHQKRKKIVLMNKNSKVFVKIFNIFALLLYKYKYTFNMALNLNINKKSFRDLIGEIQNVFNNGLFYTYSINNGSSINTNNNSININNNNNVNNTNTNTNPLTKQPLNLSQKHDIINKQQLKQILQQKITISQPQIIDQLLLFLFNDQRINLMLHKSWIDNFFKEFNANNANANNNNISNVNGNVQNVYDDQQKGQLVIKEQNKQQQLEIFSIILYLRSQCQDLYRSKLPLLSSLFLNCYKSLSITTNQLKLISFNKQKQNIFLPMGPIKRYPPTFASQDFDDVYDDFKQNNIINVVTRKNIDQFQFQQEKREQKQSTMFKKNPRKIINQLEDIKNNRKRKFKQLNFTCQGKAYKYNDEIIIPNFPLQDEDESF